MYLATRLFFLLITALIPAWRFIFGVPRLLLDRDANATGTLLDAWNRWDGHWYQDVARLGYNLRGPNDYKNVAFFPLFPLLTRTLHDLMATVDRVLGIAPADPPYLLVAIIVANACALAALGFFYGLVRLDYGRTVARRAVILLAVSPMSFYLFAAYSESTFLLCAIACCHALRLERWWQAGLWGLLAAATRPPGVILLAPFAMAWAAAYPAAVRAAIARLRLFWRVLTARLRHPALYRDGIPAAVPLDFHARGDRYAVRYSAEAGAVHRRGLPRAGPHAQGGSAEVRRARRAALPAVAIPLGLLLFMVYLLITFGDPLWFSRAQYAWRRTFVPPWETLYHSVVWPLSDLLSGKVTADDVAGIHDLTFEVVGLTLTVLAWRRLPRAQSVYVALLWIVLLSSPAILPLHAGGSPYHDVLMSFPRMMLMMFPLYTYVALHRRLYAWTVAPMAIGMGIYTVMFQTGGWIS